MTYEAAILGIVRGVEATGIAALLVGGVISVVYFLREWRPADGNVAYHRFRANLGRAILLGLEILIVADIIRTVAIEMTLENLGALGIIVLIRTFLSFALEIEIGGRLPWRREAEDAPHQGPSR